MHSTKGNEVKRPPRPRNSTCLSSFKLAPTFYDFQSRFVLCHFAPALTFDELVVLVCSHLARVEHHRVRPIAPTEVLARNYPSPHPTLNLSSYRLACVPPQTKTGVEDGGSGNALTDRELLAALDPRINSLSYVCDTSKWEHCSVDGFYFDDA